VNFENGKCARLSLWTVRGYRPMTATVLNLQPAGNRKKYRCCVVRNPRGSVFAEGVEMDKKRADRDIDQLESLVRAFIVYLFNIFPGLILLSSVMPFLLSDPCPVSSKTEPEQAIHM
jgi:hypothetical protein